MVTCPVIHGPSTTVGRLREFFTDDHVHIALLVDGGRLVGTVERPDLELAADDSVPAQTVASLTGRTIQADALAAEALAAMQRTGHRRLAVVAEDAKLLGLLCLKRSGRGFCSDADVANRALGVRDTPRKTRISRSAGRASSPK